MLLLGKKDVVFRQEDNQRGGTECMLKIQPTFDLQRDVVTDICRKEALDGRVKECSGLVDTRILNIERDGGVLYSWKGTTGNTRIGKYDPNTKQNKLLYTFDKQVCVSSCSVNKEETLLAVSLAQRTGAEERFKPVSKCLTLLIEIYPINNTKVLKAVDCRVKVQFLYPETDKATVMESHLLLLAEDGYVDQYHVLLTKQEGYRVVMVNPDRLSKAVDRVAEDISWVQWDGRTQRLYYLTQKDKYVLRAVQFYPTHNCETVFELTIELPPNPFPSMRFVNVGFDHYHQERAEHELVRMEVFTNTIGSMCVCYSQPPNDNQELTYTIVLVHKGCSKTYRVALNSNSPHQTETHPQLHPLFISMGFYMLVCVSGSFLHCINSRQQEMLCHSLFLSGSEAVLGLPGLVFSTVALGQQHKDSTASLLDLASGRAYTAALNPAYLFQILYGDLPACTPEQNADICPSLGPEDGAPIWPTHPARHSSRRSDAQRLAALHCLLDYMGDDPQLELKIIDWLCDNQMAFESFDQIQEFILASLYRISYDKSLSLDKVLPYSSVFDMKEVPECLLKLPGVSCSTELHADPVFRGKARSLQGFWADLQWNTDRMRYLEAVPNPRYKTSHLMNVWDKLRCEGRKSSSHVGHMDNTTKVLSMVDTWSLDKKLVPLFQEEDYQQRALIGLMVDKLREHVNRHLPRLGKKRIDSLVLSYVAKLLELIRHILESVWQKYNLGPRVLCFAQQGTPAEWAVFHLMCRILEATRGLCLPLPPGYNTLLVALGLRCLPHHTFLQYVDHGLLQLTDIFVSRLMTDLDNSDANEKLKFSILKRLPETMEQKVYQLWDHPVSSAFISRDYVRMLLEKRNRNKGSAFAGRDKPGFRPEFLPLSYLTKILTDVEEQALNPFEEQENVDASFVEEVALKQTLILLGYEEK